MNESEHSHMNAMARHQGKKNIFLTNEAFLWSHRFYVLGKVLQYKPPVIWDLGCGEGYVLGDLRLNRWGGNYYGVDTRAIIRPNNRDTFFVQEDLLTWQQLPNSMDFAILSEVLEHFTKENGISLLRRIFTWLNPNGKLILTCPMREPAEGPDEDYRKYGHLHYWDWNELQSVIDQLGGTVDEVYGARFSRDRTSTPALRKLAVAKCGEGAGHLVDSLEKVYGTRVMKHLFAFLRDPQEASGINTVIRKM